MVIIILTTFLLFLEGLRFTLIRSLRKQQELWKKEGSAVRERAREFVD